MLFTESPRRSQFPLHSSVGHVEQMDVQDPEGEEEETDWTSDVYARLNGTRRRNPLPVLTCAQTWPLSRITVAGFSLLMCLCGLVLTGTAVIAVVGKLSSRVVLPFCEACWLVAFLAGVLGMVVAAIGGLGLHSTLKSRRPVCSSVAFGVALIVVCVLFLVAGAYIAYTGRTDTSRERIQKLWKRLAELYPSVLCGIEDSLKCSGLSRGQCCISAPYAEFVVTKTQPQFWRDELPPCFLVDLNATRYVDPVTRAEVFWPKSVCPAGCAETNNSFAAACDDILVTLFSSYYRKVTLFLVMASVLSGVFATFHFIWLRTERERPPAFIRNEY